MNFIKHFVCCFLVAYVIGSNSCLYAQIAKKPVKDLAIGNRWIFSQTRTERVSYNSIGRKVDTLQTTSYYEQVMKDSVIEGRRYSQIFNSGGHFRWERADENSIYWWNGIKDVIAFSFPLDRDIHDTTYTEFSSYLNTNLTVSTQYRKGFGFFSQTQSYKIESWQTLSQPHFNIGSQLVYKSDVQYLNILKGAKLQDSIWGDTSFALIRLLLPDTTIVNSNSTFKVPITVKSSREIQEVFSTSPTFQLNYQDFIEPVNLPTTASLDVRSRGIILSYEALKKISEIEFQVSSTSTASSAAISFASSVTVQSKMPFQVIPSSGIIKFEGPTFPLKINIDSVTSYLNETPILPITIIGVRPLVRYGFKSLKVAINIPWDITGYGYSYSNDLKTTYFQIPLPQDSDTCIARVQLIPRIQRDTVFNISAISANPMPNIASTPISSNTAKLSLFAQTINLQPIIKNSRGQTDSLTTLTIEIPNKPSPLSREILGMQAVLKIPSDVAIPEDPAFPRYDLKNGFYLIPFYFESGIQNFWKRIRLRVIASRDTNVTLQLEDVQPRADFGALWQILPVTEGNLMVRNPIISLTLRMPKVNARIGENITIPLSVETSQSLKQFNIDSLGVKISLNASSLEPMGLYGGNVISGVRTFRISIPQLLTATTNQVNLPFRAVVGNTTTTYIIPEIQLPSIRGRTLQVRVDNGIVNTITNNAGGKPLQFFSLHSSLAAVQIAPNPTNNEMTLTYFLKDHTSVEIFLSDALGNNSAPILQATFQMPGEYSIPFNTSHLASGRYHVVIRTSSGFSQQNLTIVR